MDESLEIGAEEVGHVLHDLEQTGDTAEHEQLVLLEGGEEGRVRRRRSGRRLELGDECGVGGVVAVAELGAHNVDNGERERHHLVEVDERARLELQTHLANAQQDAREQVRVVQQGRRRLRGCRVVANAELDVESLVDQMLGQELEHFDEGERVALADALAYELDGEQNRLVVDLDLERRVLVASLLFVLYSKCHEFFKVF